MPTATKALKSESFSTEEELIAMHTAAAPKVGEQLNDGAKGDDAWPLRVDLDTLEHNGYIVVYHRKTREPSVIMVDALAKQLKKEDPPGSGQLAFQLERPSIPPYRGTIKCFLHADDPDRDKYDQFGFVTCNKHNLPSEYQRVMHMTRKHKEEWKAIQNEKSERERAERREFESLLLAQIKAGNVNPAVGAAALGE